MIDVENLRKQLDQRLLVDDLSFAANTGTVIGLLGPNGSGKSTVMRLLAGYLPPSSGRILIDGHDLRRNRRQALSRIGYLPEHAPCYDDMRLVDFLLFIAQVRGLNEAARLERVLDICQQLELDGVQHLRIDRLPKGYRQRIGLAQVLLHDPAVLLLDEPADGLDPNQKRQLWQWLKDLGRDKLIIIASHALDDVAAISNRLLLLNHGRLVADATPYQLQRRSRYHQAVTLVCGQPLEAGRFLGLPGVAGVEEDPDSQTLTILARPGEVILPWVNQLVRENDWYIRSMNVEPGRLDEVFHQLTDGEAP